MNRFFVKQYQKTIKKVYNINLASKNPKKESYYYLAKELEDLDFSSSKYLNLLPSADLNQLLSYPCPVVQENHPANDANYLSFRKGINNQIMMHSKKLRKSLYLKESDSCARCPVADKCHLKDEDARKAVCSTSDLVLYLYWLSKTVAYESEV
jgi:MoaA/NifB/PqqE/SkfB family radical SAM enzyme